MFLGALSGFTVAVTADRRAEEQAQLIARRGGEVTFGPVIKTKPLADEAALEEATRQLLIDPPDVAVLSTALGVRGWFSAVEALGLADDLSQVLDAAEVIVRGPKASGAALTAGVDVDWQATSATYREVVEYMAARPTVDASGKAIRVAVQLDGDPRSSLAARLSGLGYDVVTVPVYEWHLPDDLTAAERVVSAVADGTVDAVTFTSAHAVTNFAVIADRVGLLSEVLASVSRGTVAVVCVGPVTAERARSVGFESCIEPANARLGAMVQALVSAFSNRVVEVDLDGTPVLMQGRMVSVGDGEPVRLTERERAVLGLLAKRPGAVVSKQTLLEQVWAGESDDHVVEVTIGRLRRRLGDAGGSIETVVRRGYRLAVR